MQNERKINKSFFPLLFCRKLSLVWYLGFPATNSFFTVAFPVAFLVAVHETGAALAFQTKWNLLGLSRFARVRIYSYGPDNDIKRRLGRVTGNTWLSWVRMSVGILSRQKLWYLMEVYSRCRGPPLHRASPPKKKPFLWEVDFCNTTTPRDVNWEAWHVDWHDTAQPVPGMGHA